MITKKLILKLARENGFPIASVITDKQIHNILKRYKGTQTILLPSIAKNVRNYFGIDTVSNSSTFLLCGLSCYKKYSQGISSPHAVKGIVAPFAQYNYYAEAVQRLKAVFQKIRIVTGCTKSDGRIFCNSRAPEKFLAWISGLGFYGKNSLIINTLLGSNFIIAGLYLRMSVSGSTGCEIPEKMGKMCGPCTACIDVCPTHAIQESGHIDLSRCIQSLSTQLVILPDAIKKAFENRIYGCQICQDVCPYNAALSIETEIKRGGIGPYIVLTSILDKTPNVLHQHLKKTVLGLSRIDKRALQRNALVALGNIATRKEPGNLQKEELLSLIKPYCHNQHPALEDAAHWAERRIVAL